MASSSELLDFLGKNPQELPLDKVKEKLKVLRCKRATHKRKITIYSKKLQELHDTGTLHSSLCKKQVKTSE